MCVCVCVCCVVLCVCVCVCVCCVVCVCVCKIYVLIPISIYNYAPSFYFINVDKVSHTFRAQISYFLYYGHTLFWSVLQGKAFIGNISSSSSKWYSAVFYASGSCYLPARIMNPAGYKLWIYNPLTAWGWNIFDKKLLLSIMNSRRELSKLIFYYRLLSNSRLKIPLNW